MLETKTTGPGIYICTFIPEETLSSRLISCPWDEKLPIITFPNKLSKIFFPSCSFYWKQLDPNIQNSSLLQVFKRALLNFIRPKSTNVYQIQHPRGLKLLTRLRFGLSHLPEHKFRHNINDTIDPFCLCGTNSLETSEHSLLHCPTYACLRLKIFDNLRNNNIGITFNFGKVLNCTNSYLCLR